MATTLLSVTMEANPPLDVSGMQVAVVRPAGNGTIQMTVNAVNGSVTILLDASGAAGLASQLTSAGG
jgi:hypothetical protein